MQAYHIRTLSLLGGCHEVAGVRFRWASPRSGPIVKRPHDRAGSRRICRRVTHSTFFVSRVSSCIDWNIIFLFSFSSYACIILLRYYTMGNQNSSNNSSSNNNNNGNRPFARGVGNALGLSRSELDKRCQPSGLYDTCSWDERTIRKWIGDGKAAARFRGLEHRTCDATHECPICFLYYEEINTTKCCSANICTECFLQVRPLKEKHSSCPFCNQPKLNIRVLAGKLTEQEIKDREMEEEQINQARIRARDNGGGSSPEQDGGGTTTSTSTKPIKIPESNGFGSSLERDARVAMSRKRSESFASSEHSGHEGGNETSMIQSMAMTPEERRRLEAEMRNQNLHPLALQIEAEAEQRAHQNQRAYLRSHSERHRGSYNNRDVNNLYGGGRPPSSSSRRRARGGSSGGAGGGALSSSRDWNQIVEAFEHGGNGAIQSLDDLVVLEAAILLSMEEEARQANGGEGGGDDDENNGGGSGNFDAAGHAREGFPLVRSFLASRGRDDEPATQQQVQNLARTLNSNRRRNQLLRSGVGSQSARVVMPETALDTAALLMRGISEEEQLAMAIAASLQDQNTSNTNSSDSSSSGNGGADENRGEAAGGGVEISAESAAATTEAGEVPNDAAIHAEEEEEGGEEDHDENDDVAGGDVGVGVEEQQASTATMARRLSAEEDIPDGVAIGVDVNEEQQDGTATMARRLSSEEDIPDGVAIGVVEEDNPDGVAIGVVDEENETAVVVPITTEAASPTTVPPPTTEDTVSVEQEQVVVNGDDPSIDEQATNDASTPPNGPP